MAPNRNTLLNAADVIPRRMIHVCLPLSIPHDALSSNVGAAPVTLDRFSSVSAAQTLYHRRLSFISHFSPALTLRNELISPVSCDYIGDLIFAAFKEVISTHLRIVCKYTYSSFFLVTFALESRLLSSCETYRVSFVWRQMH
ncbi:hypothetical protein F2P81_010137 [Scophthalmus maximus]|uniref:Uncharacterized protein n=1 Tax=Scophthalmus maximus TaxID=52904 RepID=A0A6A4STH7_SCOMX|nr:hypothetical protein F2P81_010137 [Scophthalmus maximus]